MRYISIYLFLSSFFLSPGFSNDYKLGYLGHLQEQLEKLQEYNATCVRNQQPERSIYFFLYEPGKSLDFNEISASYDWFNYYLLPGSGNGLFDEHSLTYLNDQLKAFNLGGEEVPQTSSEPAEVYAFSSMILRGM